MRESEMASGYLFNGGVMMMMATFWCCVQPKKKKISARNPSPFPPTFFFVAFGCDKRRREGRPFKFFDSVFFNFFFFF